MHLVLLAFAALVAHVPASPQNALAYISQPAGAIDVSKDFTVVWNQFDPAAPWLKLNPPPINVAIVMTFAPLEFGTCDDATKPTLEWVVLNPSVPAATMTATVKDAAKVVPQSVPGVAQIALLDTKTHRFIAITQQLNVTGGQAGTPAYSGSTAAPTALGTSCPNPTAKLPVGGAPTPQNNPPVNGTNSAVNGTSPSANGTDVSTNGTNSSESSSRQPPGPTDLGTNASESSSTSGSASASESGLSSSASSPAAAAVPSSSESGAGGTGDKPSDAPQLDYTTAARIAAVAFTLFAFIMSAAFLLDPSYS